MPPGWAVAERTGCADGRALTTRAPAAPAPRVAAGPAPSLRHIQAEEEGAVAARRAMQTLTDLGFARPVAAQALLECANDLDAAMDRLGVRRRPTVPASPPGRAEPRASSPDAWGTLGERRSQAAAVGVGVGVGVGPPSSAPPTQPRVLMRPADMPPSLTPEPTPLTYQQQQQQKLLAQQKAKALQQHGGPLSPTATSPRRSPAGMTSPSATSPNAGSRTPPALVLPPSLPAAARAKPQGDSAKPAAVPAPAGTMASKLARIKRELGIDASLPMAAALKRANEAMGVTGDGPLPAQVERLMAMLGFS